MENVFDGKLLLGADKSAEALDICTKTLWNNTAPRGTIPAVRIGSRVLYSPEDLRNWIDSQKEVGKMRFTFSGILKQCDGQLMAEIMVNRGVPEKVYRVYLDQSQLASFETFSEAAANAFGFILEEPARPWDEVVHNAFSMGRTLKKARELFSEMAESKGGKS